MKTLTKPQAAMLALLAAGKPIPRKTPGYRARMQQALKAHGLADHGAAGFAITDAGLEALNAHRERTKARA